MEIIVNHIPKASFQRQSKSGSHAALCKMFFKKILAKHCIAENFSISVKMAMF